MHSSVEERKNEWEIENKKGMANTSTKNYKVIQKSKE